MSEICSCGKIHKTSVKKVVSEPGAVEKLSEFIKSFNSLKPRLLTNPPFSGGFLSYILNF